MTGKLEVLSDPAALARHVADWFTALAVAHAGPMRVALSGGSTPKALFTLLATEEYIRTVPWDRLHFFWGDERFVPHDNPDSNYRMARETMLDKVPVPPGNVHPIPTDGDPADAASRYEQTLKRAYGAEQLAPGRPLLDVNFLGIGEDGHTASLIPGQPVLDERTRWVAEVPQGRSEVRITLTYPALESSAITAFLVAGRAKAPMLKRAREGADIPAGRLRPQGSLIWFADRAAAGEA